MLVAGTPDVSIRFRGPSRFWINLKQVPLCIAILEMCPDKPTPLVCHD
jgi:hypothetical protein